MPLIEMPPRGNRATRSDLGRGQPLIAELVGPAGAGKTVMLRALGERHAGIRAGLSIHRARFLPAITRASLALLPTCIEVLRDDRRSIWPVLLQLMRLRILPTVLASRLSRGPSAIVLDEGPLFSLARLSVFQRAHESRTRLGRAWQEQLDRWTRLLDVVIWLDAPNEILMQRIRTRFKPHMIKEDPDHAMMEFLSQYRQAYDEIRGRLTAVGRARMIDVDTATVSAEQAVPLILAALTAGPGASGTTPPR